VFNRADGLAESIGASRTARTPLDLVRSLKAPRAEASRVPPARKAMPARLRAVA
jgi:hypothetical protein